MILWRIYLCKDLMIKLPCFLASVLAQSCMLIVLIERHEGEREEKEKVWRLYKRSVESGEAEHLGLRGIKVTREGSMLYIIGIRHFMDLESCYSFIAAFLSQLIE